MIDLVLLAVIGVSALLGLFKGLVRIVIGTVSWLLSAWAAFQFGEQAAQWLAGGQAPSPLQYLGGYLLVFIGVMVAVALLGLLVRGLVEVTHLSALDRLAGFLVGALRGAVLATLLVLVLGFTPLASEAGWQQSQVVPVLSPLADWLRTKLPAMLQEHSALVASDALHMGKPRAAGDNAGINEMIMGSGLPRAVSDALGASRRQEPDAGHPGDPDSGLPVNIDPAQVSDGQRDPERVESTGQARPPSR